MAYVHQPYNIREDRWEYKVVRAPHGEFGQREHLRALLHQEARAGWIMVEKYDDYQVRFKRPRSERVYDDHLPPDIDPYRTIYTLSSDAEWLHALMLAAGVLFVIFAVVLLVMVVSWP
jgi:hypothetical protein